MGGKNIKLAYFVAFFPACHFLVPGGRFEPLSDNLFTI